MELESSYNLLNIVRDDGIRTYNAIEIASGQELQIHLFAKSDSLSDRALFKALRALPVSKRRDLLEIGIEGEIPYVVTENLAGDTTAREWLTRLSGIVAKPSDAIFLAGSWKTGTPIPEELLKASHASAPPVLPSPKKEAELSPDYTRVMRVPQNLSAPPVPLPSNVGKQSEPEPASDRPRPVSVEPVIPESVKQPEPQVSRKLQPPLSEPQSLNPSPPTEEDDEFARLFGTVTSPAVPSTTPREPGEFTRQFLGVGPADAQPGVTAPSPQTPKREEPGEFTRQFLAVHPPEAPPPASPPPQQSGDSTSRFLLAPQTDPVQPYQPGAAVLQSETPAQEATQLYQAVQPPAPPPVLQADEPLAVQPPPVQPSSDGPTRLFQAVTPLTPPPDLMPQPGAGKEPGEFTRMFPSARQAGLPAGSGSDPGLAAHPPNKEGPSEFTRFFQSPMHPSAPGNQSPPPSTLAPQQVSRPPAQPSEFTQMFGNPNKPPSAASTPDHAFGSRQPVSGAPASATGLFSLGKSAPPHAAARASNPAPSGPGEFTRMMSASAPATLGQPLRPSNPPEPKAKSNILLYIAGGAVLLAILLIIVFFALRR